ncbi:MAG TPA: hypothetical protein VF008_20755, partial [Niastella sp.]
MVKGLRAEKITKGKTASRHRLVTAVPHSQVVRKLTKKTKGSLEGVAKNLRRKMGKNTAHTRGMLCLCDMMLFTTISSTVVLTSFRVERFVASPLPHRPVRAAFLHTVPPFTVSLKVGCDRFSVSSMAAIP